MLNILGAQKVRLNRKGLTEIPIERCNGQLVLLDLKFNYISQIAKIENFIFLKYLDLEGNRIVDISGLNQNL
tara:strand:- start:135 stop:350 length:216 start_codon:yes stop_codon:yes gene_type:complete